MQFFPTVPFLLLSWSLSAGGADFFVAPNGQDSWSGKLPAPNAGKTDGPFGSIARAQTAVRDLLRARTNRPLSIQLRQGTYYLALSPTNPGILNFTDRDSGTAAAAVTWENYPDEIPVVSGGVPVGQDGLGLTWTHVSGSLWQVPLLANTLPFEHLFYNGERRLRSRLQSASGVGYYMRDGACISTETKQAVDKSQCNLGSFLRVAAEISPAGAHAGCPSATRAANKAQSKCLDRFAYNPADPVAQWANLNPAGSICGGEPNRYPKGDVQLTLFDAWTVDVMRVSCVDTTNHIIYLTGATKGNSTVYNMFGPVTGHRYVVENTRDAFEAAQRGGQTGLWFLDHSTSPWTLNYLAHQGEDPNRASVVMAQLQPITPVGGSLLTAANLNHVTFRGITFEVDNYMPPATGFNNDENLDDTLPEAIDCESCQHVTFDAITVRHTSTSGILIASISGNSGAPASHDVIQNSAFYDIGDCGIRIGHHPFGADRPENVVQFVTVENNIVQGYSRVFASGEGISQANGHDITYLHNDVTDGYHTAIAVCALGCPGHAANGTNTTTQYNHIWDTMQGITSDGGTLYYHVGDTAGSGTGNKILSNLVHDTTDSSVIDTGILGAAFGGQGIYLDNNSAGIDVENNVVYNMADSAIEISEGPAPGHPGNRFKNNIFAYARKAMFTMLTPWWPQGCAELTVRTTLSGNIFYFDRDDSAGFHMTRGCDYSCGLDYNKVHDFQGNLYWRTGGGFATDPKAFHIMKGTHRNPAQCSVALNLAQTSNFLTFAEWQSGVMNEDKTGTATVDPGFGKTGKPTDFLLSRNPIPGFDYTKTNDTIRMAGRNHPVLMPPKVPHTFPTYTFKDF